MESYGICPFVWLLSLRTMSSRFMHGIANVTVSFFLRLGNVPRVWRPRFVYPFHCPWTRAWLPSLGSCDSCCCKRAVAAFFPNSGLISCGGALPGDRLGQTVKCRQGEQQQGLALGAGAEHREERNRVTGLPLLLPR